MLTMKSRMHAKGFSVMDADELYFINGGSAGGKTISTIEEYICLYPLPGIKPHYPVFGTPKASQGIAIK